jgi:hypothetical protein
LRDRVRELIQTMIESELGQLLRDLRLGDERALAPPDLDEAALDQILNRFPHGRAADLEPLDEALFGRSPITKRSIGPVGCTRGRSTVATEMLNALLERAGAPVGFDLLVIDVEGAERRVFAGFDLEKWMPKTLLVELEDEHPDFRDNQRVVRDAGMIRSRIEAAGYRDYFRDHGLAGLHDRLRGAVVVRVSPFRDPTSSEDTIGCHQKFKRPMRRICL